ncbi:MAG: ABC transporter substrate-binding protein, partial [Eubacteriales bacterium]|nr:ABC transporter substrate-binding protein [Eubacteriales bacterium]
MKRSKQQQSFHLRSLVKAVLSLGLCLLLFAFPLACQSSPETQNSDPVINPSENLIPTIVAGSETPSASLRLRYLDEGNLNPLRKHSYVNRSVFSLVYDSLFAFNAAGSLQAQLVESAQVSNDMLTWTLNLKDVNFHSGENLTAADVEASLRLWLEVNLEHSLEEWEDEEQTPPNGDEIDPDTEPDTDPDTETDDPDGTEPDDLEPGSEETIDEPDSTENDQDVDDEIEETSEPTTDSADDTYDYYIDTPVLGEPAQVESFSATYKVSLERGRLIKAIDSSDSSTIKIRLHEAAPILDLLTFPIIPAEYTESNSYEIIPGSGSYRIVERDTQGNLHLTAWQQDEAKAKEIIAVNCADVMEALALFENDELDV